MLKQNGVYGVTVGHRTIFTIEGAIELYKLFLETCYNPITQEGALVISGVQNDMVKLGFTWEEIEAIENEYLEKGAN